jgi:hypothetical protein
MSSLTDNVNLATMTRCCVLVAHRRPGVARPGDTATCPSGHQIVVGTDRVWTRAT